ncbi:MAG: hypothetical protein QXT10_02900 [Candidatus Bathyarchaeia archaeon]
MVGEGSIIRFYKRDLEDIEKCDVLIAYMPRLSAGTCMELFYAKLKGKRTICICQLENPSPWIIAHSDITIKRIKELEEALNKIKNRGMRKEFSFKTVSLWLQLQQR